MPVLGKKAAINRASNFLSDRLLDTTDPWGAHERQVSRDGTDETESDIDLIVLLEGSVDGVREIRRIWEVL